MPDFSSYAPDEFARQETLTREDSWYWMGNCLYEASCSITKADVDEFEEQLIRIREMLFGMALEAWLKGLIVAAVPRESRATIGEWLRRISTENPIQEGESLTQSLEKRFDATQEPEIRQLHGKAEIQESAEISAAKQLLSNHVHGLRTMSTKISFNRKLTENENFALDYYSQMIELGRYPATKKARNLVRVENFQTLSKSREGLLVLICDRRNELALANS